MPDQPDNTNQQSRPGFLQRWSERKISGPEVDATEDALAKAVPVDEIPATDETSVDTEAPPPVTEADLENLTYESDYTKFMGEHVPEALRRRALRQLWRSDPILANLDGLNDYDDDFTDAALAVKVLKTAHKVGQGYLTDEDLAANRARGEPAAKEGSGEPAAKKESGEPVADGENSEPVADDKDHKLAANDDSEESTEPADEILDMDDDGEDMEDFDDEANEAEAIAATTAPTSPKQKT